MPSLRNESAFVDSFMRGFSFIDDINARKRNEARLEQRLAEERQQRQFAREQATAQGQRAEASAQRESVRFGAQLADRQSQIERDNRERAARAAIAQGEDPSQFADTAAGAAELTRLNRQNEIVSSAQAIQDLAHQQQGLSGLASVQADQPVEPQNTPPPPPVLRSDDLTPEDLTLAPSRGLSEGITDFQVNIKGIDNNPIAAAHRGRAVSRGRRERTKTSLDQFDVSGLPAGAAQEVTRQREETEAAIAAETQVIDRYSSLTNPESELTLEQSIAEDPIATATQYFQDRATLASADPVLRRAVDRQIQPAINTYATELQSQVKAAPVGSPERRRSTQQLQNLQSTAKQIYGDYDIAEAAGVDNRGAPVGNSEITNNIVTEINSPERPRPNSPIAPGQINASLTAVARVKSNTRLNARQLKAVIRLRDAGILGGEEAQTLLMTGQLPSNTPAAEVIKANPEDDLYIQQGNRITLARPGRKKVDAAGVAPNAVTERAVQDAVIGFKSVFPEAEDSYAQAIITNGILQDVETWRSMFDFTNQESMIILGETLAKYQTLATSETDRLDDWINWRPSTWFNKPPTLSQLLKDEELTSELSGRFDVVINNAPEVQPRGPIPDGFPVEKARQTLGTGRFGAVAQDVAKNGSNEDVYNFAIRAAQREDILRSAAGE